MKKSEEIELDEATFRALQEAAKLLGCSKAAFIKLCLDLGLDTVGACFKYQCECYVSGLMAQKDKQKLMTFKKKMALKITAKDVASFSRRRQKIAIHPFLNERQQYRRVKEHVCGLKSKPIRKQQINVRIKSGLCRALAEHKFKLKTAKRLKLDPNFPALAVELKKWQSIISKNPLEWDSTHPFIIF